MKKENTLKKTKKPKVRATFTIDSDLWDRCVILRKKSGLNLSEIVEAYLYNLLSVVDGLSLAGAKAETSSAVEREQLLFLQETILNSVSAANKTIHQLDSESIEK